MNLLSEGFSQDFLRRRDASEEELIASTLTSIGVLGPGDLLQGYQDISPWHRGGAETFISEFEIYLLNNLGSSVVRIVAKAIVSWGRDPDLVALDWEQRQSCLREGGINTPRYYGYWRGVFLQSFIPFSFSDHLVALESDDREIWFNRLRGLAGKIDRLGFRPISLVEDLRTDGVDLYVVDFGEDLGGLERDDYSFRSHSAKLVDSWISSQQRAGTMG